MAEKNKINFEDYIEIIDIYTTDLQFHRSVPREGIKKALVQFDPQDLSYSIEQNMIKAEQPIGFFVTECPTNEESKVKSYFSLKVTFEVSYKLLKKISEDVIQVYLTKEVPRVIHPYAREVISSSLAKCALPSVYIPPFD